MAIPSTTPIMDIGFWMDVQNVKAQTFYHTKFIIYKWNIIGDLNGHFE